MPCSLKHGQPRRSSPQALGRASRSNRWWNSTPSQLDMNTTSLQGVPGRDALRRTATNAASLCRPPTWHYGSAVSMWAGCTFFLSEASLKVITTCQVHNAIGCTSVMGEVLPNVNIAELCSLQTFSRGCIACPCSGSPVAEMSIGQVCSATHFIRVHLPVPQEPLIGRLCCQL